MSLLKRPIAATTRQAVTRILGSADSLPDRSKASRVLTIVACRLQLFVFELERARFDVGLGIEQLLDRLHEHCQLLEIATCQGGGVQSGYALLTELILLLRELEASVLLLPGKLGGDARYKPALDELQALLADVSHYRLECEQTKRHLEAALTDLVQPDRAISQLVSADVPVGPAAGHEPTGSTPLSEDSSNGSTTRLADGRSAAPSRCPVAAPDLALLQRVRQTICALDLDVEMTERDQDVERELLQLRNQMQVALQDPDQRDPDQRDPDQLHEWGPGREADTGDARGHQQQHPQQHVPGSFRHPMGTYSHAAAAPARGSARRHRGMVEAVGGEELAAPASASASSSSLSGSASWSSLLSASSSLPPSSPSSARLQAARHLSRRLAAQHLARLKEQRSKLVRGEREGTGDVPPAAQRRRLGPGPEAEADREPEPEETTAAPVSSVATAPVSSVAAAAVEQAPAAGVLTAFGMVLGRAGLPRASDDGPGGGPAESEGVEGAGVAVGGAEEVSEPPNGVDCGDEGSMTVARNADDGGAATRGGLPPTKPVAGGAAEGAGQGLVAARPRQETLVAAGRLSGGGAAPDSGGAEAAAWAPAAPGSIEASVAALRKLNRVTTLAGMWEAGRPVAQQGADADDGGDGGGSGSDCEDVRSGRDHDGCLSDGDGACELPARPAAAPRRPVLAAAASPPPLPPLPGQVGYAGGASPFFMLAVQGRAPKAPPPPVLSRLLAPPPPPPGVEVVLEESPVSPSAAPRCGDAAAGCGAIPGTNSSPLHSPPAVAVGAPGGQRLRLVAAGGAVAGGGAPAPLPLPDASVHLRAVGLPGCLPPHWAPPGVFGLPAPLPLHPAAGGPWLASAAAAAAAAGSGGAAEGAVDAGVGGQVLDFGPDVPTLDLHRDITGWGPCLGRGAFGAVYKAMFKNKPAAVKVLHGGALDVRDVLSLRTEISLLCRLRHHPNIISVYGAAAAPPDHVALVTELMDCDLYDYIHRRRQNCVPLDEVLAIARAIAAGLSELHPAIVHRDLKPANVLLRHSAPTPPPPAQLQQHQPAASTDRRLTVKIADFGLARHKRSQYLSTRERDAGTLKYIAPECIASGNGNDGVDGEGAGAGGINEKCDIYSFGVLLYELITGREPWEGCHPLYAMCQVQSGATLQLPDDPDRCPPPLRALVLRCWSYQHHQRPSSRELLRELDGMIAERGQQQ